MPDYRAGVPTVDSLGAATEADLDVHTTSTSNPHSVTAAQAAALPTAGGQMSGNITMAGAQTVDGRDLSADGAVLDAATASNNVSTIVKRDSSGNFAASTITASLTGVASGNLTQAQGDVLYDAAGAAAAAQAASQPVDATLTAVAGAATGADTLHYFSAADTVATTTLTAAARTVLDDTTTGAMLTTLGGATASSVTDHTGDTSGAHAASAIANTPAGNIAATDVQAAINELDSEKQAVSEKAAANGYAGLDANTEIPRAQIASGATTEGYVPTLDGAGRLVYSVLPIEGGGTGSSTGAVAPATVSGIQTLATNGTYTLTHSSINMSTGRWIPSATRKESSVKLLVNGDSSLTDESFYARTLTAVGDTVQSSAQAKFGAGSIAFDGTGDSFQVDLSDVHSGFATLDWTAETWVYQNNTTGIQTIWSSQSSAFNAAFNSIYIRMNGTGLEILMSSNGSSWNVANILTAGTVPSAGTWFHVELDFDATANELYVFLNGVLTRTVSSVTTLMSQNYVEFGEHNGAGYLNGYLDGIRLTFWDQADGGPRHTTGFTPEVSAPTDDLPYWTPQAIVDLSGSSGVGARLTSATTTDFKNLNATTGSFQFMVVQP